MLLNQYQKRERRTGHPTYEYTLQCEINHDINITQR